ncbi:MAG: hypothetical protein ACKVQA_13980 [Burkholderiales bacterium]
MISPGILRNERVRRPAAIILVVLGGVMMWLAPSVWPWVGLLALGIVAELTGITLQHFDKR